MGGFNICIRCCWCLSCGRLLVVAGVGGAFMFVHDIFAGRFMFSLLDKSSVRVEDLFAGASCCLIRLVHLQVHVHHDVDSVCFSVASQCFSTSRVCWLCSTSLPGGSRLRVHRRAQVRRIMTHRASTVSFYSEIVHTQFIRAGSLAGNDS